ncbi:MAG: hypothetical protein CVU57_14430 [Deltaproteobacteria bacterium HGW-Deltaproteobacteria-15]|jgi:hypothetical protein|nr:MAG: hypothetical protein CVU57_14430 [Deltaproteobacteria bacterium HGW-Deltaproteobacteria-15]
MWISRSLSALQDKFLALSNREQIIVTLGASAIALLLLLQLVFIPTHDRLNRLQRSIKTRERDLIELNSIVSQYKSLETGKVENGKPGGEPFTLFSVLERFATESGLMEKIEYMRPGSMQLDPARDEKWVEIKLGRVTLKEFTEYLGKIQSFGRGIYIKRLSARKEGEYLNLILQPGVLVAK